MSLESSLLSSPLSSLQPVLVIIMVYSVTKGPTRRLLSRIEKRPGPNKRTVFPTSDLAELLFCGTPSSRPISAYPVGILAKRATTPTYNHQRHPLRVLPLPPENIARCSGQEREELWKTRERLQSQLSSQSKRSPSIFAVARQYSTNAFPSLLTNQFSLFRRTKECLFVLFVHWEELKANQS